ncbi:VOC family protein [Streptomyces acidicola]|uniref:VOC family protein n=1 Tax=Streptomyces acidicola TaxID=2596892 RepID=UPI0038203561
MGLAAPAHHRTHPHDHVRQHRRPGEGSGRARGIGAATRITAESDRLVRAGGTVLEKFDGHHVLMADPEGNEFCVGAASA